MNTIMKKLFMIAAIALLGGMLTACSSDSDEQPPVKANPLVGKWGRYCLDYQNDTIPNKYFDIPDDTIIFYEDGRFYSLWWSSDPNYPYYYTYNDSLITLFDDHRNEECLNYTLSDMGATLRLHSEGNSFNPGTAGIKPGIKIPYYTIYKKIAEPIQ